MRDTVRAAFTIGVLTTAFAACGSASGGASGADASNEGSAPGDAAFGDSAPVDAAQADSPVLTCASVDDCVAVPAGIGATAYCCLDKVCSFSSGAPLVACTDADVQMIQASDYDQSCTMDSDCTAVAEGNACSPGALNCPGAAINASAYSTYKADVAKTNAALCRAVSSCGGFSGPCCRGGSCQLGAACSAVAAGGDAGADAADTGSVDE